jgi:hypothetical protein
MDVVCVSEVMCLVANFQAGNVVAVNLRGEVKGVFAIVGNPYGMLHIKHLNLLAVASGSGNTQYTGWGVALFNLTNLDLEQPLEVSATTHQLPTRAY